MSLSATQAANDLLSCVYDIIDFELANAVDPVWPDIRETIAKPEFRRPNSVAVSARRFELEQSFDLYLATFRRAAIDSHEQDAMTIRDWSPRLSDEVYRLQHWEDQFTVEQTHEEFERNVGQFLGNYDPANSKSWAYMKVWICGFIVQTTAAGLLTDLSKEHFTLGLHDEIAALTQAHFRDGISAEELADKVRTSLISSKINLGAAFRKPIPRVIGEGFSRQTQPQPQRFLGLVVDTDHKTVKRDGCNTTVEFRGGVDWSLFLHLYEAGSEGSTLEQINRLPGQPRAAKRQAKTRLNANLLPLEVAVPRDEWRLVCQRNADVAPA